MMTDQIYQQRIGVAHQRDVSLRRYKKHEISHHHQLHQTQLRHILIKSVESNNTIYTIIPITKDNISSIDSTPSDHEKNNLQLTSSSSFAFHHHNDSVRSIKNQNSGKLVNNKVKPVNIHGINRHHQAMEQPPYNAFEDDFSHKDLQKEKSSVSTINNEEKMNHRFNIVSTDFPRLNNGSNIVTQKKLLLLPQKKSKKEYNRELKRRKKKKYLNGCRCQCSPICAFLTSIGTLLLVVGITAVLITLIEYKTATTPGTTSTSTTSTSTSTTSTSTTTTSTSTSTTSSSTSTTSATTSSTTTSVTTSTTTSATTTTTTTTRPFLSITQAGDPIFGVYSTIAGGSTGGFNGRYSILTEHPPSAIDGLLSTKYLNYGSNGSSGDNISQPGINSGFYVTPSISNASIACGLLFATGNDNPQRDPITITLEGTNSTALNASSSWALIYSGPTGIDSLTIPNRSTYVTLQVFPNMIAYQSYRLLVTLQRGYDDSVQYSEAEIMGYY